MDERMREEVEISAALDTFMYMDFREANNGETLNEILDAIQNEAIYKEFSDSNEFKILKAAVEKNPYIGELKIQYQSRKMKDENLDPLYN